MEWYLSVRYDASHCSAMPQIPNDCSSCCRRILWSKTAETLRLRVRPHPWIVKSYHHRYHTDDVGCCVIPVWPQRVTFLHKLPGGWLLLWQFLLIQGRPGIPLTSWGASECHLSVLYEPECQDSQPVWPNFTFHVCRSALWLEADPYSKRCWCFVYDLDV